MKDNSVKLYNFFHIKLIIFLIYVKCLKRPFQIIRRFGEKIYFKL